MLSFRKTETVTKAVKQKDMNMIMKKWAMAAFGVLFSLMFCFNCLGYAALSANLTIEGSATWTMPEGVFIQSVSDVTGLSDPIYNSTTLSTDMTAASGSVTITFFNNSEYDYIFDGVVFTEEGGYNTGLVIKTDKDNLYDKYEEQKEQKTIHPHQTLVIKADYDGSRNLPTIANYHFVPSSEYVNKILEEGPLAQFKKVLNTPAIYSELVGKIQADGKAAWEKSFIGNVVGADEAGDSGYVYSIFKDENGQNTLYLDVDGNGRADEPITVMIKHDNVDGNTSTGTNYIVQNWLFWESTQRGGEMTLYMTPDNIAEDEDNIVTVYAAVFTSTDNGATWTQLGDMYMGQAETNDYNAGDAGDAHNSFNTDTWLSNEVYHGAATGSTIEQVIAAYKRSQATN